MDADQGDESGEMYSPNDQREYMPMDGAPRFLVQGMSDALSGLGSEDTIVEPPCQEMALHLEVIMPGHPGHPCLPAFS